MRAALLLLALADAAVGGTGAAGRPWLDAALPIPQRVKTLMAQVRRSLCRAIPAPHANATPALGSPAAACRCR